MIHVHLSRSIAFCFSLLASAALGACSDEAGGAAQAGPEGAAGGAGAPSELTWVAHLDPAQGQLPEGLAVSPLGDTAYVGIAPTGQILAVSLADGAVRPFGSVPPPPPNGGYLLGLTLDGAGSLFVGVASASEDYEPGIFRLPATGGEGELFASAPGLRFPNGLAFDEGGSLFVTDSLAGTVFRVDPGGAATLWSSDVRLGGDVGAPCANGAGFPIGANGIVVSRDAVFVVNTDHGSLLEIARNSDGSAGAVSTIVGGDCATLGGADGLVEDGQGGFFVAANAIDSITHVSAERRVSVLRAGGGLDFPASLSVTRGKDGPALLITNAALKSVQAPGGAPTPGLVQISLAR
jgi:sugar lactone lactonase YvrE